MIKQPIPPLFAVLVIALTGCGDDKATPSSNVGTGGTYIDMRISADNSGMVSASVQLLQADPLPDHQVELSGGDELWFSYGQPVDALTPGENSDLFTGLDEIAQSVTRLTGGQETWHLLWFGVLYGDTWYGGRLNEVQNQRYYISYKRRNFTDAPASYVTLPAEFSITAPLAGEIHSRGNEILVSWDPAATGLDVEVSAFVNCQTGYGSSKRFFFNNFADTGSYTLEPGALVDNSLAGSCATTIEVAKSGTGTLDAALYGGSIHGERFSTVNITTTD